MPEIPPKKVAAPTGQAPASDNKWGVASLVCGILGIVIPYIGLILGILAIVFSRKQKKIQPNGLATAGFVLGIIGVVIYTVLFLFMIIGALAYFGNLDPDRFLPDKCAMDPPFACTDFSVQGNALEFTFLNAAGVDLDGVVVTASGCSPDAVVGTITNGESATATFTCATSSGNRLQTDLVIAYNDENGLSRTTTGSVQVKV